MVKVRMKMWSLEKNGKVELKKKKIEYMKIGKNTLRSVYVTSLTV